MSNVKITDYDYNKISQEVYNVRKDKKGVDIVEKEGEFKKI